MCGAGTPARLPLTLTLALELEMRGFSPEDSRRHSTGVAINALDTPAEVTIYPAICPLSLMPNAMVSFAFGTLKAVYFPPL